MVHAARVTSHTSAPFLDASYNITAGQLNNLFNLQAT